MEKVIKPMYLFFNYLYETKEQIDSEMLADWSHKEQPTLRYCIMDKDEAEYRELDARGIYLAKTMKEAQEELKECR